MSTEHQLQASLFRWASLQENIYPGLRYMYAIPNGGKRERKQNKKGQWYCPAGKALKDEGAKKGVPDICLPVPRKGWHGLYAEAKVGKNKCTPEQEGFISFLKKNDYYVFVFYDVEFAIGNIVRYLKLEK